MTSAQSKPVQDVEVVDIRVEVVDIRCSHSSCAHRGSYTVEGRCLNCEWEGFLICTRGHEKPRPSDRKACPRCGVPGLRGGAYVAHTEVPDA